MSLRQQKETERIMSMVESAHRVDAYETELMLLRDILLKMIARIDAALEGKSASVNSSNMPVTEDDYFSIVKAFKKGMSVKELSEKFTRHNTTIRNILVREGAYKVQPRKKDKR